MNKKSIGLFLAGLVILPGCISVPSYKQRTLHVFNDSSLSKQTEKGVSLHAKRLNSSEKEYLFNGRAATPLNDIEILYIAIYNLSCNDYILSPSGIELPQISYQDVLQEMKTSTVARLTGAAAAGAAPLGTLAILNTPEIPFLLFPMIILCNSMAIVPLLGATLAASSIPFLALLATSIKSVVMNTRIRNDLHEKTLHQQVFIKSGNKYEGLIFVTSSDYLPNFNVTLHQKDNAENSVTFDVDLH
jgi:hypothetical protein